MKFREQRLPFGDIIKGGSTGFSGSTLSKFEHNYVTINEGLENITITAEHQNCPVFTVFLTIKLKLHPKISR